MDDEKPYPLKVKLIIEIAGKPESHVNDTLKLMAEKFENTQPNTKVLNKNVAAARKITLKEAEDVEFYSGFVEFQCKILDLSTLIGIIFDWMPSSIEIIEPESGLTENIPTLTGILNDLALKLHKYDENIKVLKAKNIILERNLKKEKNQTANSQS